MSVFIKLFHKVVKERKLSSSLYKLRITLLPKIKTRLKKGKEKLHTNFLNEHDCKTLKKYSQIKFNITPI